MYSFSIFRYDLAELYLKLRSLEKAEKAIKAALEQEKGTLNISLALLMYTLD